MTITQQIKQAREAAGLTKAQAARLCGMTPQYWNKLEPPDGEGIEPLAGKFLDIMAKLEARRSGRRRKSG